MRKSRIWKIAAPLAVLTLATAGATAAAAAAATPSSAPSQTSGQLVIGNISAASGIPLASDFAFQTLNAWAKDVNSRGGINGKKVVIKTEDDKGDPAQASAAMKTLINDDHVVAIVGPYAGATESVWGPIADAAGVPVIGGGCYSVMYNTDPNFFCGTTTAIIDGLQAQAKLVQEQGGTKFGITYDSSQPQAAAAAPLMKGASSKYGVTFTQGIGVSNTAPDYTAACITFKQSGATDVGIEGAPPLTNLARDCSRQSYFPRYTSGDGQISQNAWLKDPNIKEAIAAVYSFPYLDKSTPATKRFQNVMAKYAPKVLKGDNKQPATTTWTSALMFEKAATQITAANPTAADVTAGLYTFKNETLDGLAPSPLTFTAGEKVHPHNPCWFTLILKNHKMTEPKGMQVTCTPQG